MFRSIPWLLALLVPAALLISSCGGGQSPSTDTSGHPSISSPSPAATIRVTPTPSPSADQLVSQAYLKYWQVYADAVFNLDDSKLAEVMTGPHLDRVRQEIESLRQRGRAAKIVVEHNFVIVDLNVAAGTATIHDDYANKSYEVDAQTKQMVGQPASGTVIRDNYFLVVEGGTWKVRDATRQGS